MAINLGIVGLPNVGKSTLFNALCAAGAESQNFPFCTIEPNIGVVPVPDPRLQQLAEVYGSAKVIPTSLEFVDIAGLVKGASKGEGLGNKFLANIRQVDAIAQVVRCFEDGDVVHVNGSVDPQRDVEVIETELILRDLETVSKRLERAQKFTRAAGKPGETARSEVGLLEGLLKHLDANAPARSFVTDDTARDQLKELWLLTNKPMFFIANVAESDAANPENSPYYCALVKLAKATDTTVVPISAAIEAEVTQLPEAERAEFLESLDLKEPGLHPVIRASYRCLNLVSFLTAGPQESRAWTIPKGTRAPQAAAVIHTDFERGFIRAEVTRWEDLVSLKSEAAVKQAGKMRVEGKEYIVQDGDVMHFRFNV
jgi:GTP-binding protein YchF